MVIEFPQCSIFLTEQVVAQQMVELKRVSYRHILDTIVKILSEKYLYFVLLVYLRSSSLKIYVCVCVWFEFDVIP